MPNVDGKKFPYTPAGKAAAKKAAAKKAAPAKKAVVEKKTGERYTSKAAKARHERSEGASERKREYGSSKKRSK